MTRIGLDAAALIEPLTELVARAGAAILAVNRSTMTRSGKADGSPVTEADLAADRVIAEGLARLVPGRRDPVRGTQPSGEAAHCIGSFFLIDPLDGTKEFLAGRNEFTVNLALVTDGVPLLGIVGAPALGLIWRGLVGRGAERLTIAGGMGARRTDPHPSDSAAGKTLDRGGQPLARRAPDRGLYRQPARRGPADRRLGDKILPGGGRRRRYLSPPRAHLRMGRRRWPRAGHRRRRQGHGLDRRGFALRRGALRTSSCRNSSPGAIRGR